MSDTSLLLRAYYEALYDLLEANRERLISTAERMLVEETAKRGFEDFGDEKYGAYRDACVAFIDERIETYNPIGLQYTFDRGRAKQAFELELQLNWYDGRPEFQALVDAASRKAQKGVTEENLRALAEELIAEFGAYPDNSIISTYEAGPALAKLPDYIVARAIREVIA